MRVIKGKVVSPGYGDGPAFLLGQAEPSLARYAINAGSVAAEQKRFGRALSRAIEELDRLSKRVAEDMSRDNAEIFAAHLTLLQDPGFSRRINARIESDLVNAEQAIEFTVHDLAHALSKVDDPYLREREQDIRDLGRWLLRQLVLHAGTPFDRLTTRSVIIAQEVLPSDLLHIDRGKIAAIVSERGGEVSHAVILARAIGVPFITGVSQATAQVAPGTRVLVNGETGEIWLDPDTHAQSAYATGKHRYDRATSIAIDAENQACMTLDGERISLLGNIGRSNEVAQVIQHQLDGIGLFRTEYMFLDEPEVPGLQRQREAYRSVAEALGERPLAIRTLDLGGDKNPLFLHQHFEANPTLGLRGLRFSLSAARDLFVDQLRAIVQVTGHHDIRIQFPMVICDYDLLQAKHLLMEVCREEGIPRLPKVGAMIETPSAVLTIHEILDHVDFVSIGTNDLTQFILAADRNVLELIDDYSVLHPAVLRAIKQVLDAAHARNCPVTVCGEAAADPSTACMLVGLGVRALSMSPASAARVRKRLREVTCNNLAQVSQTALHCRNPAEIAELAYQFSDGQSPAPA